VCACKTTLQFGFGSRLRLRIPQFSRRPKNQPGAILASLLCILALSGCNPLLDPAAPQSPFRGLTPLPLDATPRTLRANVASLGELARGDVVRLRVSGPELQAVLLLFADEPDAAEALLVGGGPADTFFDYPVQISGHYFVFLRFDPRAPATAMSATIEALPGEPGMVPPAEQHVRITFAEDFLTGPGLFDPVDGTEVDRELLDSLSPLVRDGIIDRLRAIFENTPVVILAPDDPEPAAPVSELRYVGDRIEADDQEIVDAALPPPDPTRPQCQTRVVFGEVLPSGTLQDTGNRVHDDQALVYVGSFQGRGQECWTSAVNSLSSMALTLAQTGAHEIGHLVGLYHVEQIDLMNRTATLAFLRELQFARGQVQLERVIGGQVGGEVFPAIVQDPETYFRAVFAER
jgi:hypothetical protein